MSMSVKVKVPGTIANCGPGFNSIGIACTIYNSLELTLMPSTEITIEVEGYGKGIIPTDERNIAVRAIRVLYQRINEAVPGMHIKLTNNIPIASGLGSSAATVVAGLLAANAVTGRGFDSQGIIDLAREIQGYSDNVAPAVTGGITLSIEDGSKVSTLKILPGRQLKIVAAIPDFGLSAKAGRQSLPSIVPFKDAVFNIGRSALLVGALCSGNFQYLQHALDDNLYLPLRQNLIPGMHKVFQAALAAGAKGVTLGGAGPCLIAFAESNCQCIGEEMVRQFLHQKVSARYLVLDIDTDGATVAGPN